MKGKHCEIFQVAVSSGQTCSGTTINSLARWTFTFAREIAQPHRPAVSATKVEDSKMDNENDEGCFWNEGILEIEPLKMLCLL